MSSTALRTFAFVLIALAVLFGVAAYYMNRQIESGPDAAAEAPPPEEDKVLAVVAIKPLVPYEPVKAEAVELVPISVEPPQYFTDVSEVVGREPVRAVDTGSPVTEAAFGRPNALAQAIPPGTQAMSLSISDVIAVGGFVQPGDFVDVLIYLRSSGDQVEDSQSRILLKNARVLAYHKQLISGGEGEDDDSNGRRGSSTAVLAVPGDQTTRVMLGASLGELRLALRSPEREDDAAGQEGVIGQVAAAGSDSESESENADTPETLSPSAELVAMADETSDTSDEDKDQANAEGVITLKELAKVEEEQKAENKPSPPARNARRRTPRRASIEVYQGAESSVISRPY